ncbi:MAG: nucleotide exchange factor GrpE [Acidobacteria bacterium]|nr:nucleotide exchange factor GrpE [Acidobacteriota bacterium]
MQEEKNISGSSAVGVEEEGNGSPGAIAQSDRPPDSTPVADTAGQLQAITAERDRLAAEKADLHDRLLRRQAEFENARKRAEREKFEILEFASMEAVRAILPVLDDFERALRMESADKEYARGIELICQRLLETLKKLGLEPIETGGQTFDPNLHHAVDKVQDEEHPEGAILEEHQRGYHFKGRLLRPAMVRVAVRP